MKDLRRLERRLCEEGPLRFESIPPTGNVDDSLDAFLQCENSGVEKQNGTAINCRDADRASFLSASRNLFQRGRL